jgi:hypothetical protein
MLLTRHAAPPASITGFKYRVFKLVANHHSVKYTIIFSNITVLLKNFKKYCTFKQGREDNGKIKTTTQLRWSFMHVTLKKDKKGFQQGPA